MDEITFEDWKWQTESMLELRVGASWTDLCGDDEVLLQSYLKDWSPRHFCDWFITKYDLTELSEIGLDD